MTQDEPTPRDGDEVAAAAAGRPADVIYLSPPVSDLATRLLGPQPDLDELLSACNDTARTAWTAGQVRDDTIRRAILAGADPDSVAQATGLTVDQVQRITLLP